MSPGTKRILLVSGLIVAVLAITGLFTGAIGAAFMSPDGDGHGILAKPSVHLPPQPLFPTDARHHFEEFEEGHATRPFANPMQFLVTNTLLSSWLTTIVLAALFIFGTTRMKLVPRGIPNLLEIAIETLLSFIEGVVGEKHGRTFLPIIATIFLFVAFNAWIGLLPIYPALGWIKGDHVAVHLLRPAGTDLNMPLALALISFVFVEFSGLRVLGLGYLAKFVRLGSLRRGLHDLIRGRMMTAFQGLLDFFFVGPLEAFSECVRIVSFTFRLFGNMTAGEILILLSAFLVPFVATVGVYGLEILVGFVQALIFAGLTLVFASLAIAPHAEENH